MGDADAIIGSGPSSPSLSASHPAVRARTAGTAPAGARQPPPATAGPAGATQLPALELRSRPFAFRPNRQRIVQFIRREYLDAVGADGRFDIRTHPAVRHMTSLCAVASALERDEQIELIEMLAALESKELVARHANKSFFPYFKAHLEALAPSVPALSRLPDFEKLLDMVDAAARKWIDEDTGLRWDTSRLLGLFLAQSEHIGDAGRRAALWAHFDRLEDFSKFATVLGIAGPGMGHIGRGPQETQARQREIFQYVHASHDDEGSDGPFNSRMKAYGGFLAAAQHLPADILAALFANIAAPRPMGLQHLCAGAARGWRHLAGDADELGRRQGLLLQRVKDLLPSMSYGGASLANFSPALYQMNDAEVWRCLACFDLVPGAPGLSESLLHPLCCAHGPRLASVGAVRPGMDPLAPLLIDFFLERPMNALTALLGDIRQHDLTTPQLGLAGGLVHVVPDLQRRTADFLLQQAAFESLQIIRPRVVNALSQVETCLEPSQRTSLARLRVGLTAAQKLELTFLDAQTGLALERPPARQP